MARLKYYGRILEVPSDALVIWSMGAIVGPIELVGLVHWAQYFAMPGNSVAESLRVIDMSIQQLRENTTVLDDARILYAVNLVLPCLEAFALAASDIRGWQEKHITKKVRTAHNRSTKVGGPRVPPWHDNEEFQTKIQKSSAAFSLYLASLEETIRIIREAFPATAPSSWAEQLDRAAKQIPDYKMMLEVGYEEAVRRKAVELGYLPPA